MLKCFNCGHENPCDSNFCENCGHILVKVNDILNNLKTETETTSYDEAPKSEADILFSYIKREYPQSYYSYYNKDIEYIKDSKIVSIFTKKWRELCSKEFIVIDFETTGLNYTFDRIIEIAAVKYVDGIVAERFTSLVNPLIKIPREATEINHITDDMVSEAPTERYIIPQLIEFLSDSLIVGHNVNFDLNFLEVAAQRYGYNVKYNYIDTLSISRKIFQGLPNHKLSTIADYLGFDTKSLHRAENDTEVCAEIIRIALNNTQ